MPSRPSGSYSGLANITVKKTDAVRDAYHRLSKHITMVENERIKFTTGTGPSTGPIT